MVVFLKYGQEAAFPQPEIEERDHGDPIPMIPRQFGLTKLELFTIVMAQGYRSGKMINHSDGIGVSTVWSSKKVAEAALEDAKALIAVLLKEASNGT